MIPSSCWVFLYLIRVDCIVQSLAIVKVERSFWPFFGVNCPCGSGLKIFRPKNGAKILKLLWWDRVLCTVLKCFCCSQSAHVRSCYVRIWSIFSHFFLQRFFPPVCMHCLSKISPRCVVRSLPKLFLHVWDVMEHLLKRFGMTFDVRVSSAVPVPKIAQMSPESP